MPSVEGTPLLSIVVEDEDRSELAVDLDAILREGARRMLVTALRAEADEYIRRPSATTRLTILAPRSPRSRHRSPAWVPPRPQRLLGGRRNS